MNGRQQWLNVCFFLALLISVFSLSQCSNPFDSGAEAFNKDFAIQDTSSIDKIILTDTRGITLKLSKTNKRWLADDRFEIRMDFLESLMQTFYHLKKQRAVAKNLREQVMVKMNTMAKKIEVYDGEDKIREMYLSAAPNTDVGSYMYLKGDEIPYVVVLPGLNGTLESRFNAELSEWKSHEIFKYRLNDIKSISMEYPLDKYESFQIDQTANDQFTMTVKGETKKVKKLKALSFLNSFSNINAEGFENEYPHMDSIKAAVPFANISVVDRQEKKNAITLYRMPNYERSKVQYDREGKRLPYDFDRYFAVIRDGRDFVIVQHYVFEKLLRKYSDFED